MKIKTIENGKSNLHINKNRAGADTGSVLLCLDCEMLQGGRECLPVALQEHLELTQEKRPLAFVTSKRTLSLIMMVGGKKQQKGNGK